MKTIWKFPFKLDDIIEIQMPEDAVVLHAGVQGKTLCLWAMVDTEDPLVATQFRVFRTGHQIPLKEGMRYAGTVFQDAFAWHIFHA